MEFTGAVAEYVYIYIFMRISFANLNNLTNFTQMNCTFPTANFFRISYERNTLHSRVTFPKPIFFISYVLMPSSVFSSLVVTYFDVLNGIYQIMHSLPFIHSFG